MYGRSDKRYCSSSCRRVACRIRRRTIRFSAYEFEGTELQQSSGVEQFLIPRLQREYGPNHRVIRAARRLAEQHRDAEYEHLLDALRLDAWRRSEWRRTDGLAGQAKPRRRALTRRALGKRAPAAQRTEP
jgi:hypothetical protein